MVEIVKVRLCKGAISDSKGAAIASGNHPFPSPFTPILSGVKFPLPFIFHLTFTSDRKTFRTIAVKTVYFNHKINVMLFTVGSCFIYVTLAVAFVSLVFSFPNIIITV